MKRLILVFLIIIPALCFARMNAYVAGSKDNVAPTVKSCSIAEDGKTVTITFSEPVNTTGYDDGEFTLDASVTGDDIALNTITGTSGLTRTLTSASTIVQTDTVDLDYNGDANDIEDKAGNDLADITSDVACTNSSTQGGDPCASCNTGTDSKIVDDTNTADTNVGTVLPRAKQFTIAAETCVTGVWASLGDGNNTVTITGEIYTDSSSLPGSRVGDGYTGSVNQDTLVADYADIEILFASTQTLAAGTYWIVLTPSATNGNYGRDSTSPSGTFAKNDPPWSSSTIAVRMGVMGCSE